MVPHSAAVDGSDGMHPLLTGVTGGCDSFVVVLLLSPLPQAARIAEMTMNASDFQIAFALTPADWVLDMFTVVISISTRVCHTGT